MGGGGRVFDELGIAGGGGPAGPVDFGSGGGGAAFGGGAALGGGAVFGGGAFFGGGALFGEGSGEDSA